MSPEALAEINERRELLNRLKELLKAEDGSLEQKAQDLLNEIDERKGEVQFLKDQLEAIKNGTW